MYCAGIAHDELHFRYSSVRTLRNRIADFVWLANFHTPTSRLMESGIAAGHISAVDFAQHAEHLGFTRCQVPDTPLIRSNLFATMAAVALKTKTIESAALSNR